MPERRLRLLCLDGGGVRGLASLYLLKQILSFVGNPKPHEFFDMIAGTSTGGQVYSVHDIVDSKSNKRPV